MLKVVANIEEKTTVNSVVMRASLPHYEQEKAACQKGEIDLSIR